MWVRTVLIDQCSFAHLLYREKHIYRSGSQKKFHFRLYNSHYTIVL